jgi:short-subunit dehydrogenase
MALSAQAFLSDAGGVDLVVANAGVGIKNSIPEGDARDIAWMMNVNVVGVTNTVVPFVPAMMQQHSGVLVAVGSFAGHRALPGRAAYAASKAAVKMFMDGLRMDLHGTGVHSMTFCPGFVKTPLTESNTGMIFVIDVDEAVRTMVHGIERRADTVTFPWQMNALKELITRAPESLVRRMAPPARAKNSQ